ncbi:MAG TPA: (deoxy)nucleoside triphosphate pyrophosphohydrolase [candidate division Zixibacteria bacterium]|nr:(deoxy)nucleoside triphosphate pyrophosphohydrolase [candidate division Zixibacteria bacterium]
MKVVRVVAGIIERDGRLLVCQRRADAAFPLKWEFPGGKVEAGEDREEALRRELREELAIEAGRLSEFQRYEHRYANGTRVDLSFYAVHDYTGEVQNRAFERIAWVERAGLSALDFLEGDRAVIEKLLGAR